LSDTPSSNSFTYYPTIGCLHNLGNWESFVK